MADIRLAAFTVFDTPVLNTLLRAVSKLYLIVTGWKLVMVAPVARRTVVIAAPHTSNWDMPMGLAIVFAFRLKVYFLAKHTLFTPPFGILLRWLGGIPVDRSKAHNLVDQAIELFSVHEDLVLVIPPEGTRKQVLHWKSGFYHIACGAQVPLSFGFIDYKRKVAGFGGTYIPSGNYGADLVEIQAFYAGITGKNRATTSESARQPDIRT
jgi:1-acyl-sn-glycerol-3-phosphate acyltransferase